MSRQYRDCESKLKYVNNGSKNNFLNNSNYYSKLSEVADERPFLTSNEDNKCRRLADTIKNLYNIKNIVNSSYFSSDKIDKMNDIINSSSSGEKDYDIATSVKNELECIQINNNATCINDYHRAYDKSKVSYLYNYYRDNENKAKDENADRQNSILVGDYNRTFDNLYTLKRLYDQSSDNNLKNTISNNYVDIFRYLIKRDNNSAISRSFNSDYDYNSAISSLENVINNYNNFSSSFSAYDYSIKNTLDQNLKNLKEKKINFYIIKAREYLNNKNYSSAKSYINMSYDTAYSYGKSTSYIVEYRKKIYNAESDYYNSEGRRYFYNKDYGNALDYYNRALNCLSSYRDNSLENNIRQNIEEVENTRKNLEANKLHKEGLDKFKEKKLSDYDLIKNKFTSAYSMAVDSELKNIIKKDLDNLENWKLNLSLENIKNNIEKNEPKALENSLDDLKSFFTNISNSQGTPYKGIIETYINEILNNLFKYYSETFNEPLDTRIEKTEKFLSEMKSFNNNNNFTLKVDENEIKYCEGIIYCLEAEKIRKKRDKESYREAYFKYREGLKNYIACEDLVNHMQIWKKNMFEAFCKKCLESGDDDELEEFIKKYETDELNKINKLKSHLIACNAADKCDDDNISKEDKKNYVKTSLEKEPNNPSLHQMNIAVNNDSDESQNEAIQNALKHCPDDPEINHMASNKFSIDLAKGKNFNEEEKKKLNAFNNKLLNSKDEVLQNDGLNFVHTQNAQKHILDKSVLDNLYSLQKNQNENTAIKASRLIADNLKINNTVDINKDEEIKTIIYEGIKNENPQIQDNYLGLMAEKGKNFENAVDSGMIVQICEKNIKEGINLDNSFAIMNNISINQKENNITITNETTKNIFSNLNISSQDNANNDNMLSILKNSSTNLSKEQTDIYKENLPNLMNKYPDNEKSVELLDNFVSSKKSEVTPEIVNSLYDGLNSNKPEIKEKYVSIIEKIDNKNIKEISSDISNSLINIMKNENKPEVKNSILNIFQKNLDKFDLNENQKNQIETQRLCNKLDNALRDKKKDSSPSFFSPESEKEPEKEKELEKEKEQEKEKEPEKENEPEKKNEKEKEKEEKKEKEPEKVKEPEKKKEPEEEKEPKKENKPEKEPEKEKEKEEQKEKEPEEEKEKEEKKEKEPEKKKEKEPKKENKNEKEPEKKKEKEPEKEKEKEPEKEKEKEDDISKILDEIKKNINNIKTEEKAFQNKIACLLNIEGYDEKLIEIIILMINKAKTINNDIKKSICNKISKLLTQNENGKNNPNLHGYFYILNNSIKSTDKNEEKDIVNLYTNLLNNITKYNNNLLDVIISGSILLLKKQKLKIDDDISSKLFEVYQQNKDSAENISILLSNLYADNSDNINLEKIFTLMTENKTNENIVKNCCLLLKNKERVEELFKNKKYQEDAINIIKDSKIIPIEIIEVVDLIEDKIQVLEDIIQLNKYFINIKKEKNININVSALLNYKNKEIKLNDEHLNIIFSKLIKNKTMKDVYKLLELVSNESISKNFDSINKLIGTKFFQNVIDILIEKKIKLSQEIVDFYIKKLDSDDEQEYNKTLEILSNKIKDSLNQEQKQLIEILQNIKEENLINDREKIKSFLDKINKNKIPNKRLASFLGKIILETTDNQIFKEVAINYFKNLSNNLSNSDTISEKIFERIKKNLFETEDENIHEQTIELLDSFDGMQIEIQNDFIIELMTNDKLNLNNNQKLTASIMEYLLNLIKSNKLEFKTFYENLCQKEDIKKLFESLNLDISSTNKINENIEKIREAIKDYSYYKYNLDQIILDSVTDIKEGEEEKFNLLYKDFVDDKTYSIIDKYLFVKILLNPKNTVKYNLSQINDVLYIIKKIPMNVIFEMKENSDFYKEFKLQWLTSLLNKNAKKYVDNIFTLLEQNDSFTLENIETFLSNIDYDNNDDNEQMLVDIIESINHHKIKFNEFEEIYEEKKAKIKLKDLFNTIIDKVFENIFGQFDNAEQEILNAKKIFKKADWNMETFRYMVDTDKRGKKPFLFYSLENKNDVDIINKACEIICLFELSNGNKIIDILEDIYNNNPGNWEEKWILELNKLTSLKIKEETKREDQPIENYLKEIFFCNEKKENGKNFIKKENINKNKKLKEYLVSSEQKYSQFLENIKYWNTIDCIDWINDNRHLFYSEDKDFISEVFAVFSTLNKCLGEYKLRRIQLLSLVLLTSNYPYGGVFCEIGTGEGKSTIVEFLAAFLALTGNTVDIISSSPILAKRDAEDPKKIEFFNCLGLSVSYSSDENDQYRYKKRILYGDVLTNEGDILRDVYEKTDIRKGRGFHYIIIDEVDNLSLDNLSSKAQLVSFFPGKEYLYPFYFCILIKLRQLDIDIENADKLNKIEIVKSQLLNAITKLYKDEIKKPENDREIFFPEYLKEEINKLIPLWIESAITIYYYMKENKDYIINENGEINPVDYSNTGMVQRNMVWENGMHQMLQILNVLRIHPESTGTNYLSNVSYFKKYFKNGKSNIFGVTGTIGEISSQKILIDIYKVNIYFIPRAIKKQLRIYGAIIVDNRENWFSEIMKDAIRETRNGRAVLIICKSIGISEELFKLLKENKTEKSIKNILLYNKNEDKEEIYKILLKRIKDKEDSGKRERIVTTIESELSSGTIIISTNLAGRGTDVKLNQDIVNNGGLHVIVSFLPENKRIEDQNFGRAARKGQPGTGRLILNKSEEGFTEDDIREVKKVRAQNEYDMITKSMKTEVPKHIFEDELFDKFCEFLDEIDDIKKSKSKSEEKERSICIKENTEELWGAFIKEIQDKKISENEDFQKYKTETLIKFEEFKKDIRNKIKNKKIFKNPFLSYKRLGKILYNGFNLDDFEKTECESLLKKESFLNFGLYYNYAVYNVIEAKNFNIAKEYYNKTLENLGKLSDLFLDRIPILNSIVINPAKNQSELKRKIPIQKSFDNKKISINAICEMINKNLQKIEEFQKRSQKEDEIYLVRDTDKYIKHILTSKTEIKDEIDLNELEQFYEGFGIEYLIVLKIRKETNWFTFFVVLFTGIIEVAIGAYLMCSGFSSLGAFLLKEGITDIKKSIQYVHEKKEIKLGDWVKDKSINFLAYVATCLLPGASSLIQTKGAYDIIKEEVLDRAQEFIKKKVLSHLKEKFKDFIQSNFIDKILSLFDKYFDKMGKIIAFVCDAIDSAKSYINDIVTSFKSLIIILIKIKDNIVSLCRNTIDIIKNIKNFKVTQIVDFIQNSTEIIQLFNSIKDNLSCLPKLIEDIMGKFNFEKKLKNIGIKNILCGDEEYNYLYTKYNGHFEISSNTLKAGFKDKFNGCLANIKTKFEKQIDIKYNNLQKQQKEIFSYFNKNFDGLFRTGKLDENVKNIFNNYKGKLMEEIKDQININITNIKNDVTQMKGKMLGYISSIGKEIESTANDKITQSLTKSSTSLFDNLKNNFKEYTQSIPKDNFNVFIKNYFHDNLSNSIGKINEHFNFNSTFGKVFDNNIKKINNLLKEKIDSGISKIKGINLGDVFNKDIIEELKNNIKEKKDIENILDEKKNIIIGNLNDNFKKVFDIQSIDFNFDKDELFNSISGSIEKLNPFNLEKINSLKQNLFSGFTQLEEKNLLDQPTNLLYLLKTNLNFNEVNKFSLNDCKKISRILISNGVINKKGEFNKNLFKNEFEQFIKLDIPSLEIPTETNNNVSSYDEIDFKEFSGSKKDAIINAIKNLGKSVDKSTLINFKQELKSQISDLICKEIEKLIDDIFDFGKYF